MLFIDYYEILELALDANASEIKTAYRRLGKKFHPDLHPNHHDATAKMQSINEAYLILSDIEARYLYDKEWTRFYSYKKGENKTQEKQNNTNKNSTAEEFHFEDERLRSWINSAKKQARDITRQTVKDAGGILKDAGYAASISIPKLLIYIVIVNILFLLFKYNNWIIFNSLIIFFKKVHILWLPQYGLVIDWYKTNQKNKTKNYEKVTRLNRNPLCKCCFLCSRLYLCQWLYTQQWYLCGRKL